MPMSQKRRAERLRQFIALEERGLVERHTLPNGCAFLRFPQGEDHPAVRAFAVARDHVVVGDHTPELRRT